MVAFVARPSDERQRRRSSDEREFRLLVALTFPIFLVVVLVNALIGKRPIAHAPGAKLSIYAEVKAAASTAIALGFMG